MFEFIQGLLSNDFMPHGACYRWQPDVLWLHVLSDSLITLSYFLIPLGLVYFVKKRKDLEFDRIFWLFGAFILLCGLTHLFEIWSVWNATYRLTGLVKAGTGIVSFATAIVLFNLIPKALQIPSAEDLRATNERLRAEVAERERAEAALQALNDELEGRVASRTAELAETNAHLKAEIEKHRQTEAALRASEARNRAYLDAIPDAIFRLNDEGVYLDFVPAEGFEAIVPPEEMIGHSIVELLPADVATDAMGAVGRALKTKQRQRYEYQLPLAEETRDFEARIVAVEGREVLALVRDITEEKNASRILERMNLELEQRVHERTQELEEEVEQRRQKEAQLQLKTNALIRSNEELERFAYIASHDLQEPLRTVSSFVQLLQRRYAAQLGGDADEYINYIVDGVARMKTLINDLLAFSRVTSRAHPFDRVAIESVVTAVKEQLNHAIVEKQATITIGELPVVKGDEGQLRQVFLNLINNALKFAGEETPRIEIRAEAQADSWRFAVQDNGIGLDPQYADRIFVIFQRLHTRDQFEGTGIGLAITKKIIERHGGTIWVEAAPGQGATFYFTLPFEPVDLLPVAPTPPSGKL